MIEDANRASAIITRIRRLLKKAEPELGLLNLKGVVEDVLVLTKSEMAKRKIRIRLEIPDHLPKIVGDRIQIQQVLMNLVMNGMEAMNASPSISRTIQIRGDCRHDQDPGKAWVQVSVQDSGTGLKEDEINRLFEAFYSTKPSGLGMGLAICRTIVDSHGGRLWATSNPGPGTTFHFILPAAEAGI
jgi:signal transduction histidine kinase